MEKLNNSLTYASVYKSDLRKDFDHTMRLPLGRRNTILHINSKLAFHVTQRLILFMNE